MKLLVAVARPLGLSGGTGEWLDIPDIDHSDISALLETLSGIPHAMHIDVLPAATLESLSTRLMEGDYQAVHLICHGSEGGHLFFEDEGLGGRAVTGQELFDALSGNGMRCLTLAACHGQAAIDGHFPAEGLTVVAVNPDHPVYVAAAGTFCKAFYSFLMKPTAPEEAFKAAVKRVCLDSVCKAKMQEVPDLFRLLAANGGLFEARPGDVSLEYLKQTPVLSRDPSLGALGTVAGRRRELFEVCARLQPKRMGLQETKAPLQIIVAPGGMGKTVLARKTLTRLHEDRRFPGGMYEVGLLGKSSVLAAAEAIFHRLGLELPALPQLDLVPVLAQVLQDRSQGQPILLYLDNIEDALGAEGSGVEDTFLYFLEALTTACGKLRILATSQVRAADEDEARCGQYVLTGLDNSGTLEFVREFFKIDFEQIRNAEERKKLTDLTSALHQLIGGHPLCLSLLAPQYKDDLNQGASRLEALRRLVSSLKDAFSRVLTKENGRDSDRHRSIVHCLNLSLSRLSEAARNYFLHLCLFPDGLTLPVPGWLHGFLGYRDKVHREVVGPNTALVTVLGEPPYRKYAFVQPALRRAGAQLCLEGDAGAWKRLVALYAQWLEELPEGTDSSRAVGFELENVTELAGECLGKGETKDALKLDQALTNHLDFIQATPALLAHAERFIALARISGTGGEEGQNDLAAGLSNLGAIYSGLGQRDKALDAAEEATDIYRRLAAASPPALPALATSLNNCGVHYSGLGQREKALKAAEESVHIRRLLAAANPQAFLPALANSLNNLGAYYSELGQGDKALAATEEALHIRRQLAAANPQAFLPDLANGLNNLGAYYSELDQRDKALAAALEATDIYRRLAAASPQAFFPDLAACLNNLGNRYSDLGQGDRALAAAAEAVEIRRQLAGVSPQAFLPDLAGSLNNLGLRHVESGNQQDGCACLVEALTILVPFYDSLPDAFGRNMAVIISNLKEHCPEAFAELLGQAPDGD